MVFAGEARSLKASLAQVAAGNAFLLQAGDCAESFEEFSADNIREKLRVILQMAVVLTYSMGVPVVKVGRIAGQFAKPRSSPIERIGERRPAVVPRPHRQRSEPVRRVTGPRSRTASCRPTTSRRRRSTCCGRSPRAASPTSPGCTPGTRSSWPRAPRVAATSASPARSTGRCGSCGPAGIDTEANPNLREVDVYTSHEALILGYEEALTRQDTLTGDWYDCSAHMLWIGERTRELDGAHVEFLRGVGNPLGCKIGPTTDPAELLELCETLNPERVPGRLTLISRMGADDVEERLRRCLRAVTDAGHPVVWACDPMHGNTYVAPSGRKTRHFDDDRAARSPASSRRTAPRGRGPAASTSSSPATTSPSASAVPTSCSDADLDHRYETICDPRLNARQSLDLAFRLAELITGRTA